MSLKKELRRIPSPAIRLAVVSLVVCGLVFPLVVTGFAQVLFHDQAQGSIATNNGKSVGSYLIAQNFSQPYFFHSRNSTLSASGVDPDITKEDALAQVSRVSNSTGIGQTQLVGIINQNVEGTFWIFGYPYVNVLKLNLALVTTYPTTYRLLDPSLFNS